MIKKLERLDILLVKTKEESQPSLMNKLNAPEIIQAQFNQTQPY